MGNMPGRWGRGWSLGLLLGLSVVVLAGCSAWSGSVPWASSPVSPSPPSPTASPTTTATQPAAPATPAACDRAAPGLPLDVTIPDDTVLEPGAPFTKVWRVRNVGTCTWTRAYALVWVSGPPLAAATRVPLPYEVPPQATINLEVPMQAPTEGGLYHSNWMLSNPQGRVFGLGPAADQPLWVRFWVPEATPAAPTPASPTATPSPTPSPSPTVTLTHPPLVHETRAILPAATVDLDALLADGVPDVAYRRDETGAVFLEPLNQARLGVFGPTAPDQVACRQTPQTQAALPLNGLPLGMYLCFTTDAGRVGWLRFVGLDAESGELTLEVLTWPLPEETP